MVDFDLRYAVERLVNNAFAHAHNEDLFDYEADEQKLIKPILKECENACKSVIGQYFADKERAKNETTKN